MAGKGRLVLGVDINPVELCVVGMRGNWANPQIVCAGSTPLPPGAVEGSTIHDPPAVAEALRKVLSLLDAGTRDVIIGVAGRSVLTRVLDIPKVPDQEMRTVIQGELVHYQILRDANGAFDYMRLQRPEEQAESGPQALVMAAEDVAVQGYRAVAELADVRLIALEPILLAMYRVAFARMQTQEAALCLALSHGEVEITIVSHGQIRLYRRVDMGRNSLIGSAHSARAPRPSARPSGVIMLNSEPEEETPESSSPEQDRQINVASASNLVLEIQRSLDYYGSQYPQAAAVHCAVVATNEPDLKPLAGWLSQALSMETLLAELPLPAGVPAAVSAQLTAPDGQKFLGAIGLAMHELIGPPAAVPCFDLANVKRSHKVLPLEKRSLAVAAAGSCFFLLVGAILGISLGQRAGDVDRMLGQRQAELKSRLKVRQTLLDEIQAQTDQLRLLQPKGFPVPRIMDAMALSVAPNAGLTSLSLDPGGRIVVTGEAADQKAIITTLELLKNNPIFENTSLDTFDTKTSSPAHIPVVTFQVSSKLVGAGQPPVTPETSGTH